MPAKRILVFLAIGLVVLSLAVWLRIPRPETPCAATLPTTRPATQPKAFTNTLGMKFVPIAAGTFVMGSPKGEEGRQDNETQHEVTLSKPFWMQTTEVTQKQWTAVMGHNPSHFKGDDLPVEQVSWNDAQDYIKKLSEKEKGMGVVYRLPTEAEWEYACRAGTQTRSHAGDGDKDLDGVAWHGGNGENETHPAATRKPNAWGLYDMHGNVWEWCSDWYAEYDKDPARDPQGPVKANARVLRGNCWNTRPRDCRSAIRIGYVPACGLYELGFRLAADSVGQN